MREEQIAGMDDADLEAYLVARNVPILSMDTEELGDLFGFSFNSYTMIGRHFKNAPFCERLHTSQKQFPSFAYPDAVKDAKTPEGSGEAADSLHMSFRKLGMRLSNVFMPEVRRLISSEADTLVHGWNEAGERIVAKDRPPSEEARNILNAESEFVAELKTRDKISHLIPMINETTKVRSHKNHFSVLETALAIREQSISVFPRSSETFQWVRDVFSLQSVETIVQTQDIIRRAMETYLPELTLEDVRLTVERKDLITYARAVFERLHETRREHALAEIIIADNGKGRSWRQSELALKSVGRQADGFHIQSPLDAAAVAYAVTEYAQVLPYWLPEDQRSSVKNFSARTIQRYRTLAARIFECSDSESAASVIREHTQLFQNAERKNMAMIQGMEKRPINFGVNLGMVKAHRLLNEFCWNN